MNQLPARLPQNIEDKAPLHPEHLLRIHSDAIVPDLPEGDLWVFGYGSLMWRPGLEFEESLSGKIFGFHRALCVSSWVHRGTPEKPGLVLGLDQGGSCKGKLFRVNVKNKQTVASYLYDRELPTLIYKARIVKAHTADGRQIKALSFIVDINHPQYIHNKSPAQLAEIVCNAVGINGKSSDYLYSTLEHLQQLNIKDAHLESIAALVGT